MRFHVVQVSNSRLSGADVGASYKNVKWRTPLKQINGQDARIKMQSRRNLFTTERAVDEITGAKLRELSPVAHRRRHWPRLVPPAPVQCFRAVHRRQTVAPHSRSQP